MHRTLHLGVMIGMLLVAGSAWAQPMMEKLTRGVIAVNQGDGKVFVSWRLFGNDPDGIAFNLYRKTGDAQPVKLNAAPLTGPTCYQDTGVSLAAANQWFVRPVVNGQEQEASKTFMLPANAPVQQYISIKLREGLNPNDASAADLDGDGEYEIILKRDERGQDNSRGGITGETHIEAYKLDGTFMWRVNMGRNIRSGAHYTQFMVADFDGDGKAEMFAKTADGTVDGTGKVIGNPDADWRSPQGHILSGPEFLTVFDGMTGKALATVDYVPERHPNNPTNPSPQDMRALWGDSNGNRSERYLAAVAYLDGKLPSAVMCRGYYTRAVLAAWDWRDGKLTQRWVFDSDKIGPADRTNLYRGQGNHNMSVADVDGDGKQEIIYGACAIDDDGKGLHTTGWGHGDAMHVGDLDPTNPGIEVFNIQERFGDAGANMRNGHTGAELWKKASVQAAAEGGDRGEGPGRAASFNIDPRYPGSESWVNGAELEPNLWSAKGEKIGSARPRSCNFAIFWDGDPLRELLDRNYIAKWNWEKGVDEDLFVAEGCTSNNGTKATPTLSADLFGDWREELVLRTQDNSEIRIFTTTIPTQHRLFTLMHDPQYRVAIAWQNTAYNQPPHPSFYLGDAQWVQPAKPNITVRP